MNCTLIGIQRVDFIGADSRPVSGYNFYLTYDQPSVSGSACMKIFVSDRNYSTPVSVGDYIRINFNRYGKLFSYELCSAG